MRTQQHDEATERMLASFAKCRKQRKARGTDQEPTKAKGDAEELALFNAAEARAINGSRA